MSLVDKNRNTVNEILYRFDDSCDNFETSFIEVIKSDFD